jgi:hypothetical protein
MPRSTALMYVLSIPLSMNKSICDNSILTNLPQDFAKRSFWS